MNDNINSTLSQWFNIFLGKLYNKEKKELRPFFVIAVIIITGLILLFLTKLVNPSINDIITLLIIYIALVSMYLVYMFIKGLKVRIKKIIGGLIIIIGLLLYLFYHLYILETITQHAKVNQVSSTPLKNEENTDSSIHSKAKVDTPSDTEVHQRNNYKKSEKFYNVTIVYPKTIIYSNSFINIFVDSIGNIPNIIEETKAWKKIQVNSKKGNTTFIIQSGNLECRYIKHISRDDTISGFNCIKIK